MEWLMFSWKYLEKKIFALNQGVAFASDKALFYVLFF